MQIDLLPLRPAYAPLLTADSGAEIHQLDPQKGLERFLTVILDVIERSGPGAFYVFDCLSDLAADWFSDRMLGNFFMISCPCLYELPISRCRSTNTHSTLLTPSATRPADHRGLQ